MSESVFGNINKDAISVKQGTVIMREGEVGNCAYFLVQGRLLVEKNVDGENIPIAEIMPRDMVGEFAILDDSPRSATVTAVEDSVLLVLNKHRIRTLIRRSPAVAEVIMKLLCHKLRMRHQTLKQSQDLEDPNLWRKITTILLLCAKGDDNPASLYQNFTEHLEMLLELPIQTIKVILTRLEEAAVIETRNGKTLCVNEEKLQIFVDLCTEEYANIHIEGFSPAVEYHAAQVLLQSYAEAFEANNILEIEKNQAAQALVSSAMWGGLRPHFQYQRSEAVIEHLLEESLIRTSPTIPQNIVLNSDILQAIHPPQEELIIYESMKTIFLK